MIYDRHLIQFNDLVFDGSDMISGEDGDVSFKGSSSEYSYGHGSYRPYKRDYLYVASRTLSATITLNMRKLPCEHRPYYIRFVNEQLTKPGKLWCIKNGELLWAFASVENVSEAPEMRNDKLVYDVSWEIPGGIWHKADKQKTFLLPWDICTFMDCMGYKTLQPCQGSSGETDCCETCVDKRIEENVDCSCCCVDDITEDMALCYHLEDIFSYYTCDVHFQVVNDCVRAEKFNRDDYLGQRLCTEDICDDAVIAGQIYSETEIPTEDITATIRGKMVNPWIEINGNTNIIKGEYEGTLIIYGNGDVYFSKDDCCEPKLLDPSVWIVPEGNVYGWTLNPRNNRVVIRLNACCSSERACAWIWHQPIAM